MIEMPLNPSDPSIDPNQAPAPTPLVSPHPPQVSPSKDYRKLTTIIISLVALGLIATAAAIWWSESARQNNTAPTLSNPSPVAEVLLTPDPTEDWRTISRRLWTFKVPADWHYLECSDTLIFVGPDLEEDQTIECAFGGAPGYFQVGRVPLDRAVPIPNLTSADPLVSDRSTIFISNQPAIMQKEVILDGPGTGTRWAAYIETPNHMDVFWLQNTDDPANKIIYDQILTTFQYTGLSAVPSPSPNYLTATYTDPDVGFRIGYNNNWELRKTYGASVPKSAPTDIISGIDLHKGGLSNIQAVLVVNVLDAQDESDVEQWITKYDQNAPSAASREITTFNNLKAVRYRYRMQPSEAGETWYFIKGKYAYRVSFHQPGEISQETQALFNSFQP